MTRKIKGSRKTKETNIIYELNLDGTGKSQIKTGIPFLDHMLELFTYHGLFDLTLIVKKSDLAVDIHHTNEDVGICIGEAFKKALGNKKGIKRFGSKTVPMDEASAQVALDISERPSSYFEPHMTAPSGDKDSPYNISAAEHFFKSFAISSGINLHIRTLSGQDFHHILEAVFKAFGMALCEATRIEPRRKGKTPSTKGKL